MAKKIRLDQLLVQRGLAESRTKAQALIMAGAARVVGAPRSKAGEMVAPDVEIEVVEALPYASRGGYKLAHALDAFGLSPAGLVALDTGASTGGFTDVLLQRGAARVYAVDVGYGLIDWRLRQDPRVVVVERTNIRYLEALPVPDHRPPTTDRRPPTEEGERGRGGEGEDAADYRPPTTDHQPPTTDHRPPTTDHRPPTEDDASSTAPQTDDDASRITHQVSRITPQTDDDASRITHHVSRFTHHTPLADCATIDVSFISLRLVLPAVQRLISPDAWIVALVKPQFEAGVDQVGKGGVVRDPAVHVAVLREVLGFAAQIGLAPHGLARSPITGPAGNVEFLAWLGGAGPELEVERAIGAVLK
jgi:predicted rRNA methylase YqxC with S4 and FtsJ domains